MECGGTTPLSLRVGDDALDGRGLAVGTLSGKCFGRAAGKGHNWKNPSASTAKAVSCHRTPQDARSAITPAPANPKPPPEKSPPPRNRSDRKSAHKRTAPPASAPAPPYRNPTPAHTLPTSPRPPSTEPARPKPSPPRPTHPATRPRHHPVARRPPHSSSPAHNADRSKQAPAAATDAGACEAIQRIPYLYAPIPFLAPHLLQNTALLPLQSSHSPDVLPAFHPCKSVFIRGSPASTKIAPTTQASQPHKRPNHTSVPTTQASQPHKRPNHTSVPTTQASQPHPPCPQRLAHLSPNTSFDDWKIDDGLFCL